MQPLIVVIASRYELSERKLNSERMSDFDHVPRKLFFVLSSMNSMEEFCFFNATWYPSLTFKKQNIKIKDLMF